MSIETIVFCIITYLTHQRGICTSPGFIDLSRYAPFGCPSDITFFEYFESKYFHFALELILILATFLILTKLLGKWTDKNFAKNNPYQKIFTIELWSIMTITFGIIMLIILDYGYNEQYCPADNNCVNISLLTFIQQWLNSIITGLRYTYTTTTLGILAIPYLTMYIYQRFKKTKAIKY